MKFLLFFACFVGCNINAVAQLNIGIGTSSPQAKLDIVKSFRVGGITSNSSYLFYDSATGNFNWNNSNLFVPANQALMRHSASTNEGLYYNSGQLEYRNASGLKQFATNWINGDGYVGGFLGIGRNNPGSRLHFASEFGEKIIFWGGPGPNYGIGIQPSQLQIHTDLPESSITFGYGSSTNFTELVRLVGDGRMGIGTNNPQSRLEVRKGLNNATAAFFSAAGTGNPGNSYFNKGFNEYTYIRGEKIILNDIPGGKVGVGIEPTLSDGVFEVAGRMRCRGGDYIDLGLSFQRSDASPAGGGFVGTSVNYPTYLQIFCNIGGLEFRMDATNGSLYVAQSRWGNAGQVLKSDGPSSYPKWVSPTNVLFNNTSTVRIAAQETINGTTAVDLTGMSKLVSISSSNANILFTYNILMHGEFPTTSTILDVVVDGAIFSRSIHFVGGNQATVTGTLIIPATAGNHLIKMMASTIDGPIIVNPTGPTLDCMFIQILNK